MSLSKSESGDELFPSQSLDKRRMEELSNLFIWYELTAKSTFDTPHIGWRTVYATICIVCMLPVALIMTQAISNSLDGKWVGLPIAIVLSAMLVSWARRGDADARLRKDVLPMLGRKLRALQATDAEIVDGWRQILARDPKLARRFKAEEILHFLSETSFATKKSDIRLN
jgi:hypothetical protein